LSVPTAGQVSEHTQAEALIVGFKPDYVRADKGYDSDAFVEAIKSQQAIPVIPPKNNRKVDRDYDRAIYKERNLSRAIVSKVEAFSPYRHTLRTLGPTSSSHA
jgi:IS5 family transposase